jgi:hypothetical protein
MAEFFVCWSQCKALANAMREYVVSFEEQQGWHTDKEGKPAVS